MTYINHTCYVILTILSTDFRIAASLIDEYLLPSFKEWHSDMAKEGGKYRAPPILPRGREVDQ
jgi:hypothetical protein